MLGTGPLLGQTLQNARDRPALVDVEDVVGEMGSWEQGKRGVGNMGEREVGSRWSGVLGIINHDQDLHRILDRVTS